MTTNYTYDRTATAKTARGETWGSAVLAWMEDELVGVLAGLPRDWKSSRTKLQTLGRYGYFTVVEGYTRGDLPAELQLAMSWHKGKVLFTADFQVVGRGQERLVAVDLGFDEPPGSFSRVLNAYLADV